MASSFLCLLFISLSTADGFMTYRLSRCDFNSTELKDIQFTDSYYYNYNYYYQTHCYLEYTPRSGEKISCVVEHASLEKPLITNWDPSSSSLMPKTERDKLAIGASGLILCLILSLAGFMYYRQRARGRILVPTD
ncbi:class II histocompatibility antigen, B-L beta chain-like [Oreochromis aureus]|uniref:Uncharacterized protein n=1 Tax=Oreochromis aureus TaxID=47969 RepID=A0AAZ1WV84_OREAU|nr:class II histocompatibility antigen, B-L beta chain-like [Oreochromis aureus]CAI5677875.1 unnamed protein product [Mustela putorius furo]